jgi:hypothetical protein
VPIVIGFLANQVGLSGVGKKIGEMIERVREMVDKALEWLVNKAVDTGMKLLDKVVTMGKEAAGKLLSFLGINKVFTASDGSSHKIYISGSEASPVLMVESDPKPVKAFLDKFISQPKVDDDKKQAAKDAKQYIIDNIDPVFSKLITEKDDVKKTELQNQLLTLFTTVGDKIRILLGKTPLNKIMEKHKYNLEGMTGTYGSMPKPVEDKITADHQPQAAIIKHAASMEIFAGKKIQERAAGPHANGGFAINLHSERHKQGRTYTNKGKGTLAQFSTDVTKIAADTSLDDNKKRREVIKKMKYHLSEDVKAMKAVAGSKSNYSDLDSLGLEAEEVEDLRKTIKAQILSGEAVLESQNLDDLVN